MRAFLAPHLQLCALALVLLPSVVGCEPVEDPGSSYYDQRIGPIFDNSCARQNVGCHVALPGGEALGNLDFTSFDSLMRRRDVLAPYGPYSVGLLFLKAGDPSEVSVETWDDAGFVNVTTNIQHNAGSNVRLGSSAFAQLKQWVEAGHTRTGVPPDTLAENLGDCVRGAGSFPGFDPNAEPADRASYDRFVSDVQPALLRGCAGSRCHGAQIADLYLTCGEDEAERRWNYFVSVAHLSAPASTSPLLRQPLSTQRGGVFHEGGNVLASTDDPDYVVIREWADELVMRAPELIAPPADIEDGFRFFVNRVQPVLIRKGCTFLNCHSPSMFHDLRLRGGAQGIFSRVAMRRNYEMSLEQLALDASDPNESRIIAKNLYPPEQVRGASGIFHRGGPLFEDFGMSGDGPNRARPELCDGVDADGGDLNEIPAYCVLARWHELEREGAIARGELFPADEIVRSVVWVSRPTGVGEARDFDTYRPGADLRMADASVSGPRGELSLAGERSLLAGCGLDVASADVRHPAVSWDGGTIAFAARSSADAPLRLYWMDSDGSGCERIPGVASSSDREDGILLHDFDPAFAPDGRLVFASTRGNLDPDILGRSGPTRTPAAMQPNANLYIEDADGSIRQLTYLLNQEIQPAFMTDGRLIFTAEKRAPEFHQLAGRRINLDGGDYHPLFGQRETFGFRAATEIVEMLDRNLAIVAGPIGAADGAGTIMIVNRSIGPDQDDRDPGDRYYIASRRFPRRSALDGGTGVFRSPAPLPTGRLLVSCDTGASDVTSGGYAFQLCEMEVETGALREIGGDGGRADIEAVPVFARAPRHIFDSRFDEANGSSFLEPGATDADVVVLDFPLLATLLFENTRERRRIDHSIGGIEVFTEEPPPAGATDFGGLADVINDDFGQMYLSRRRLGHVPLEPDGSARFRYPGGLPLVLGVTDGSELMSFGEGEPFTGERIQREQMQFYPGERIRQGFRRELFNGMCGGCHGSITGRELDVAVDVDVLTSASWVMAMDSSGADFR